MIVIRPTAQPSRTRGFTMIELIVAMAIFTMLGSMVIFLMRRGIDIFEQGTAESAAYDRMDTVLPLVEQDLRAIRIVIDTDPPPLRRDPTGIRNPVKRMPPPPVLIRLRSAFIPLKKDLPEGDARRGYLMPWFCMIADMSEGLDPILGNLPAGFGEDVKDVTPETVALADDKTRFLPSGGLFEVCYIAVPENPNFPSILTLYRGFRAPIGHPEHSLLLPGNLDTIAKIKKACRPVATGLTHFGITWRRVFASSWEPDTLRQGPGGSLTKYVGPVWDSTRGVDKGWAMFVGKESLADPSDDVFPAFVRLEVVLANPTRFGFGRGDTRLRTAVGKTASEIQLANVDKLLAPGLGRDRYLKIGTEWMRYRTVGVDYEKRTVRVERGMRGSKAVGHVGDEWVYLGLSSSSELKLPVYKDRFTLK